MLKQKKAIFACSNYWSSPIQVGDHQLARQFATSGWQVAFLSIPITPLHLFKSKGTDLGARLSNYFKSGAWDGNLPVWNYVPGALLAPANIPVFRSKWVARHWLNWTVPKLTNLLKKKGFGDVELLYIRDARFFGLVNQLKFKKSVFRIADRDKGFSHFHKSLRELEADLARRVDLVAYSAQSLGDDIAELKATRTLLLPNGVDFTHFSKTVTEMPPDMSSISRPVVVYVGSLDYWFDWETINDLAKKMPNVSFVLIGPNDKIAGKITNSANVFLLGRKSYQDIPGYLANSDIGIVPFNTRDYQSFVDAINPLKLYEYLAAGLPVVATRWKELETIDSPAKLCNSVDEFESAITCYLKNKPPKAHLRAFAKRYDWSSRYETLVNALDLDVLLKDK